MDRPAATPLPPVDASRLLREERASALTHGFGAVAALAGGTVLVVLAALRGDGWQLAAAIVFSLSMLLLYVASTLYHAIPYPKAKARLKVFDHCAIYLLIAGTYTPFTLVGLRGEVGRNLFVAIWALAAAGIAFFSRNSSSFFASSQRIQRAVATCTCSKLASTPYSSFRR